MGEKGGGVLFVRGTPGNLQLRQHASRAVSGKKIFTETVQNIFFCVMIEQIA